MAPPGKLYWLVVGFLLLGIVVGASCWAYQISQGLGVAGVRHPVVWGTYLVNFVFWVGIAHSGTLISAILFLLQGAMANRYCQEFRSHDGFCRHDRRPLSP